MRQRMVLVAGLLALAGPLVLSGCGAPPATRQYEVTFELETVNPSAYTDISAYYSIYPFAHEGQKKYSTSLEKKIKIHYPDVDRIAVAARIVEDDDTKVPDPGASAAKLRCQIYVDDVLVAQNVGLPVTCEHTMTAGRQVEYHATS